MLSRKVRRTLIVTALAAIICAAPALATTWDLASSFNATSNPSGGWTFGGYDNWWGWGKLDNIQVEGDVLLRSNTVEGWVVYPRMIKNNGSETVSTRNATIASGQVVAEAGAPAEYGGGLLRRAVAYFVVPTTGTYYFDGSVVGAAVNQTSTSVLLQRNAYVNGWANFGQYWGAEITQYGQTATASVTPVELNAGDWLQVLVESSTQVSFASSTNSWVGLDFRVSDTLVPEPSGLISLLTGGLVSMGFVLRRRR